MRLYLSGPMTGVVDHNFPRFNQVTAILESVGFSVENPAAKGEIPGWEWPEYMRYDFASITGHYEGNTRIGGVEGIATLENWRKSKGARREVGLAKMINIPVKPFSHWVREANLIRFAMDELVGAGR